MAQLLLFHPISHRFFVL